MARYSNPFVQYLSGSAAVLDGNKLSFFEPGTTTPKDTFSDSGLTTANANPVVANADGRIPDIFLDGTYNVVLKDKNDVTIDTADPVGETTGGQFETWLNDNTYNIPDIVKGSDNNFYRSLTNSNQGNDPTTSAVNWEELELGRIWNTNIAYAIGDSAYGSDGILYYSNTAANSGNNPVTDQANWRSSGGVTTQIFTASGTWTKPENVSSVLVFVVGGGGGAGGVDGQGAGTTAAGSGGSGAGYAQSLLDVTAITSSTITIGAAGAAGSSAAGDGGAGGNSIWSDGANTLTGVGGGFGRGATGSATSTWTVSNVGGTGTGGDINGQGETGEAGGTGQPQTTVLSGYGGASLVSAGKPGVRVNGDSLAGTSANANSGAGGSGGAVDVSSSNAAGGAGGSGIIIVYEYT